MAWYRRAVGCVLPLLWSCQPLIPATSVHSADTLSACARKRRSRYILRHLWIRDRLFYSPKTHNSAVFRPLYVAPFHPPGTNLLGNDCAGDCGPLSLKSSPPRAYSNPPDLSANYCTPLLSAGLFSYGLDRGGLLDALCRSSVLYCVSSPGCNIPIARRQPSLPPRRLSTPYNHVGGNSGWPLPLRRTLDASVLV